MELRCHPMASITIMPSAASSVSGRARSGVICSQGWWHPIRLTHDLTVIHAYPLAPWAAKQVLTLFPDLTLAVEEGEPELAHDFFSTVKVPQPPQAFASPTQPLLPSGS